MSLPKPPSPLTGACSVIHDNTLYVYTQNAFMSLPLEKDAEWKKLATGEKVSGGVCVGTDSGLFVVGGTGGSDSYTGLQKFTYGDKKWSTITLSSPITKNLQHHGAAYLKSTDRIFVYAGTKDGSETATSEGWVIGASEPHTILAAGPTVSALNPILLPWSDTDVCFVGGSDSNTAVSWYNPDAGWRLSGTTLSEPIPSSMRAVLVPGDDGSISLYVFDLTASPNKVRRHLVWTADNQPVTLSEALTKRDATGSDWPAYNATLAPKEARSNDYTVAQDSNGKIVFVGGSDKLPVAMFDGKENAWMDSVKVLGSEPQKLLAETTSSKSSSATKTSTSTKSTSTKSSSTVSSTSTESFTTDSSTFSTSTATATDSSTASWTLSESSTASSTDIVPVGGATKSGDSGLSSSAILGITLGTILGFLAALIVILLLLRRRKKTRQPSPEAAHARHNYPPDEKDPKAFGNGQLSPNSAHFRGHNSQLSQESYSSMAILMGRAGKNKTSITRKPSSGTNRSSVGSLHKQLKATISKPILQEMQHPVLQGQDTRGVSFDPTVAEPRPRNGPLETQDGMRRSSGWNRYWSGGSALQILGFGGPKRNTVGSDSESHYSDSIAARNPRVTQDSATVPPLNFDFRPEMNRVNSGSPVVAEYSKIPFRDGVAGKIERPTSKASSGYSSGIPESINETWDPDYKAKPWGTDRAPSSVYNPSFYFGTPLSPSVPPPPRNPPSGVSTQPQLAMASTSSDMSWLNLGDRRV
ncbi:Hypothetical protein NCS54_00096500 [Fusarium falciforme]|uniref:Hypothetical protein n=1 Tax=Fusarium falciforme TaxID=195108 RepID=UPI0023000522|nr:Hypothetical protein NCS54_00096500 [Fusarium falciforme]WAO83766.1 Hypothetical protein NCS54_00096500 [Fusarium falciforme]